MSMEVEPRDYMHGGFNCECGTVISFTLDSRLSVEQARHYKLVMEWRALQEKRDQQETQADGR